MRAGSVIREEWPSEAEAIAALTTAAFAKAPHAGGNEAEIIAGLRAAGDLALSLVATDAMRLIGQVAFSPVSISDGSGGWFGLGPVSVLPQLQGHGIGGRLIRAGLERLAERGAQGVVLLGNPDYYGRFGFRSDPRITFPGAPPQFFQALVLAGEMPLGTVRYVAAFG